MTLTPQQQADVNAKNAETAKAHADAEKTRAEAEKSRADAEQVRASADAERRLAQNKLDVAAADLDAKRIANDAARQTAHDTHTDKLIEQLTGAVPDVSSIAKNSVSFRDGKALRQGESTAVALKKVAGEIAAKVAKAARTATGKDKEVFVVTDPGLVTALAVYRQLFAEATVLKNEVEQALTTAEGVLPTEADEPRRSIVEITATAAMIGAAVAGKAITELASLFELDVDIATDTQDVTAATVQAAVVGELLNIDGIKVRHESARIPTEGESELLTTIKNVTESDIKATSVGARLDAAIKRLGDPEGDLAQAEKALKDAKADTDKTAANDAVEAAKAALVGLKKFQDASTDLTAILEKARAFAERIVKAPDTGGPSLLSRALSVEPLAKTDVPFLVLVVGAGKAETYQVVVKRRIRFPRIQTSTSVAVDFLVVDAQNVVAGGHETGDATYAGIIDSDGTTWKTIKAFDPMGVVTEVPVSSSVADQLGTAASEI